MSNPPTENRPELTVCTSGSEPDSSEQDAAWLAMTLIPESLAFWAEETAFMCKVFQARNGQPPEFVVVHPATWKRMRWVWENGLQGKGDHWVYLAGVEVLFDDCCCRVLIDPSAEERTVQLGRAPTEWWEDFDELKWLASFEAPVGAMP